MNKITEKLYANCWEIARKIINAGDDLLSIVNFNTYEEYNKCSWDYEMSKEEFDILKKGMKPVATDDTPNFIKTKHNVYETDGKFYDTTGKFIGYFIKGNDCALILKDQVIKTGNTLEEVR